METERPSERVARLEWRADAAERAIERLVPLVERLTDYMEAEQRTRRASLALRARREAEAVETQRTVLAVATAAASILSPFYLANATPAQRLAVVAPIAAALILAYLYIRARRHRVFADLAEHRAAEQQEDRP